MQVIHPIFVAALCSNREYLGGGGEMWGSSFINSLHAHIRRGTKGASAIGPQLSGEVFSTGGRGPKSPIYSRLFSPYAARCAFHKLPHGKGLTLAAILFPSWRLDREKYNMLVGQQIHWFSLVREHCGKTIGNCSDRWKIMLFITYISLTQT